MVLGGYRVFVYLAPEALVAPLGWGKFAFRNDDREPKREHGEVIFHRPIRYPLLYYPISK